MAAPTPAPVPTTSAAPVVPAAVPTPAPSGPDVSSWLSPALTSNPGLASDVATTSNNQQTAADVVSHANNVIATTTAVNKHIINNGTQGFWSRLGGATWSSLSFLGKPLEEVQKDYKFIHAVYADHGVLPGLLATLGVAGGAVAGGFMGGGVGAAIGGDLAASGIRALLGQKYTDSLQKADDPNYKVSFGRDFSGFLGNISDAIGAQGIGAALKNPNKGLGKFVSGGVDAVGDYTVDPVMVLGKANMILKSGRFLNPTVAEGSFVLQAKYPLARVIPGVQNWLTENSMRAFSPEQMDAVRAAGSNGYTRALDSIAQIGKDATSKSLASVNATHADLAAGTIAFHYPALGTEAAGRLGAIVTQGLAKNVTENEVHQFLKSSVYFNELNGSLAGAAMLPSRTLLNPSQSVMDYVRNNPGLVGTAYKTFTGYMPFSVDPLTQKMSTETFRWNSPDAASVIYRSNRFSQSHQYGLEMAGQYATAVAQGGASGLATARLINGQSTMDMLKVLGLPDHHFLVEKVAKEVRSLNDEDKTGLGTYGISPSERGANISDYVTTDGKHANAAIGGWQASDVLPIPNYLLAKRALRDLGLIKGKLGALDDFVSDYYTNKFFKPLALATAGFGIRVAASELLLAASRYGPANLLKAKIASSAIKAGYAMADGEAHHFTSAVLTGLGVAAGVPTHLTSELYPAFQYAKAKGLKFAANLTAGEQLDVATQLAARHGASIVSPGVSSGHGDVPVNGYEAGQNAHNIFQKLKSSLQYRDLPTWTTFTPDSKDYAGRYATSLNHWKDEPMGKNIANDITKSFADVDNVYPSVDNPDYMKLRAGLIKKETQRILDTKAGTYQPYRYESNINTRWRDQNPKAFAADRVDTILGLGIGKDGTVNHDIFYKLVDGRSTAINEVRAMDRNALPAEVAGQQIEPYLDSETLFNRVIGTGFKKVFNPIINNLAREPLYVLHVGEEYGSMKYAIAAGHVTPEQAFTIAENRAVHSMIPEIHNTMLKTQFAVMARNFFPFYFAQEQAWKRSLLAMKNTSVLSPIFSSTVRTYQMVEHLMSNPTFVTKDNSGNAYANIPVVGEFGKNLQGALASYGVPMVSGLPISVSGSLSSLKSVIPDMNKAPGVSPFIAVAGNLVADWFPGLAPEINAVMGQSAGRGFWDTVNPNAMSKSLWNALSPNDQNAALQNALFGAMSAAFFHKDPGFSEQASPSDKQALIDRIKNNARSILIMKAALNILSPLAPKVEQVDVGLREEFLKLLKSKGSFPDALLPFLKTNGDSAVSYSIAKSQPAVPGANIPLVTESIKWLKDNADIVHSQIPNGKGGYLDTSVGALYLVPQDPGKSGQETAVYQDLLRQHLRSIRTPMEFLNQMYIAAGDQEISPLMTIHKQRVAEMTNSQDTVGLSQEATAWAGVMKKMENLYPIWFATYNPNGLKANASVALGQFRTIFASPNAPKDIQSKLVQGLVNDYDVHNSRMTEYKQVGGVTLAKVEKDQWTSYLKNLVINDPRLKSVVNSVFLRLD